MERAHPNYAHRLPLATQARLIKGAKGISGANLDYLVSTVRHLRELGIRERELERLVTMIGPLAWQRSRAQHTQPLRGSRGAGASGRSVRPCSAVRARRSAGGSCTGCDWKR